MSYCRFLFCGFLLLSLSAYSSNAATVTVACHTVGIEFELCKDAAERWAEKTGNKVEFVTTPHSSTEKLAIYQQLLSTKSKKIDVFQIDTIWPGLLHSHFIDLYPYINDEIANAHFNSLFESNIVNDKLVAIPWFTDAGVLYYRKDLLKKYNLDVPNTWKDLTEIADYIQTKERVNNPNFWGFVFQAKAYEGLTCNALEWIDSFNGGTIIDENGNVTINNEKAVEALSQAAQWVAKISPKGVLNYTEEEARGVFQSGNALFMRNWPYAWSLAQAENSSIRNKIGIAPLPKGSNYGKNTGTLGGWQLAVSKYSNHPDIAADLVLFLTSKKEQKIRAIKGSYNPTIKSLYKDKDVLAKNPFMADLYQTFLNAVARPSKMTAEHYNRISYEFWNAIHKTLSGKKSAKDSLYKLEIRLKKLKARKKWAERNNQKETVSPKKVSK